MGAVTFGSNWKLATWPGNPCTGNTLCFDFEFDGAYFRQITPYVTVPQRGPR